MPSYLVTGANRGIGLAIARKLSTDKANTVIGLVRDKGKITAETIGDVFSRDNVSWIQAQIESRAEIYAAVPEVAKITGGSLDVLIANAGMMSDFSELDGITELALKDPAAVEEDLLSLFRVNVVAQIHLFNAFLPLIKAGSLKKVIAISTGLADLPLTYEYGVFQAGPYSISKAALNMAVAKLHAEHRDDGILFLSVAPGLVETGHGPTPDKGEKANDMVQRFLKYQPDLKGPITPDESAALVLDVVGKATVEADGGKSVSQFGNTQWL